MNDRSRVIIRTSVIGILTNLLLAGFKAAVGLFANSIAIVLDAVNNLSDALRSVITIIGTRLAGKKPDKQHPYGHGRVEYLSAAVISVIILYAGVTSLVESIKKIIHPETPDYGPAALIIVGVALLVKILLGTFVKKTGERVNADTLVASGKDALNDAIISASTLAAAVVFLLTHVSLEAWLGAVIALVIIKSGIDLLRQTISEILGQRVDSEIAREVKASVLSVPQVRGAYDLILHNYGPNLLIGSVHIEVDEDLTARQLDALEREIANHVAEDTGVILTGIGIYAANLDGSEGADLFLKVRKLVMAHDHVLQIHGFYVQDKDVRFDLVVGFEAEDRRALLEQVRQELMQALPEYNFQITLDADISD